MTRLTELAPPNMALQRTPRPRFLKVQFGHGTVRQVQTHAGTGRSLRSLGAPLNAQPLGATRYQLGLRVLVGLVTGLVIVWTRREEMLGETFPTQIRHAQNVVAVSRAEPQFLAQMNDLTPAEGPEVRGAADASDIADIPKISLAEWLRRVQFVGLGRVKRVTIDTARFEVHSAVRVVEKWWGTASSMVMVGPTRLPNDLGRRDPVGEGQKVVLINASWPKESSFFLRPVIRLNGTDAFEFEYGSQVALPPSMYLVPRGLGAHGPSPWGLVALDAFREAVQAVKRGA